MRRCRNRGGAQGPGSLSGAGARYEAGAHKRLDLGKLTAVFRELARLDSLLLEAGLFRSHGLQCGQKERLHASKALSSLLVE